MIYSYLKHGALTAVKRHAAFLTSRLKGLPFVSRRNAKGEPFVNRRYTKGVPFMSKKVYLTMIPRARMGY